MAAGRCTWRRRFSSCDDTGRSDSTSPGFRLPEVADRVLWGTDWPSPGVKDMRQNIDQFVALPLSDAHRKAILETNALALFPAAR